LQERKKLGRGIEEISHYFLSSTAKEEIDHGRKRWISISSCGSVIQKCFLISNLSFEIAAQKKRVVIFDHGYLEKGIPLFMDPLKQEFTEKNGCRFYRIKQLPDGFGEILIITANHTFKIPNEQSETALGYIEKQVGAVDIVFVNNPSEIEISSRNGFKICKENIIITSPEKREMLKNYSLIKKICGIDQVSTIGLIVNRVKKVLQAVRVFRKMAAVSNKYLKKELLSYGFFYDDLIITRTILKGVPLGLSYPDARLRKCLCGISNIIINNKVNERAYNSRGFFDKTTSPTFRSGIIENNLSLEEVLEFAPPKEEKQF